jgi:hypothetical protein
MAEYGRHIFNFEQLAEHPAVTARLAEIEAEAKKGGEEIRTYFEEHYLQL